MNKKGISITEIIISITLTSIVLVFLLNILITVRNENDKSNSESKLLINQSLITKDIETDFINLDLMGVSFCNETDINSVVPSSASTKTLHCLRFNYNASLTKDSGYLLYYTYNYQETNKLNVVGYKRGSHLIMRETDLNPLTSSINANNCTNNCGKIIQQCQDNTCSLSINLPLIGTDGGDYGINLSYVYDQVKKNNFAIPAINTSGYNFMCLES